MKRGKKAFFSILLAILSMILLTAGISEAITLSVSPNPATAGQTVTATVTASYPVGAPLCGVQIRFSASDPFTNIGNCTTTCNVPHIYSNPGSYTVTVHGVPPPPFGGCVSPSAPSPVSTNVTVNCPAFSMITTSPLPGATYGSSYSQQIQTSGGLAPITYSIVSGSLPPGLSMNTSGLISGSPTTSGNYTFTVRATDSCVFAAFGVGQTADRTFSLQVNCPSFSNSSGSPSSGTVGQAYSFQYTMAGGIAPYTYSLSSGSMPPGLSLSSSGLISGTPITAGTYSFGLSVNQNCPGSSPITVSGSITIIAACPALNITTSSPLPSGIAGQSYSSQIQTSGGQAPISFSIVGGSLPAGLSMSSTGLITGTPSSSGTSNFIVRATDSCGAGAQTADRAFSITINSTSCPALSITSPPTLSNGTVTQAYTYQITTSGGQSPITFSIVSGFLPSGLNLSSSGLITGTPSTNGTFNFTVQATDSCAGGQQTAQRAFTLTINPQPCPPLNFTSPPTLSTGTINQAYSYQLSTTVGQAPVTFSIISGSLPSGMNMSSAGLISGIPTSTGTSNFTVRATDSCAAGAQTAQSSFSLTVNRQPSPPCAPLKITSLSLLTTGMVSQPYSYQTQTSGGQSPITFSLASGTMPPGLSLSPSGLISGTPNTPGNYSFTVMATDTCPAGAQNAIQSCSIYVQPYQGTLSVLAVPSSFSIPRSESSALNVNYQFSGTVITNAILSSPSGVFMVGDTTIEVNPTFLTVNVRNGSGRLTENISVPVRILEEAMKKGSTGFVYKRTFSSPDGGITLNTMVNFTITTEAGAAFEIRRIDLYFENRRPEITIPRNYPNLRAFADIRFVGSGLLQGFWEVDGRILSRVDRHLLYGSSVTLETPEIPPLPTFDPGYHIVKFIITNPVVGIPLKEILYFVTTAESPGKPLSLKLYSPENGEAIEYGHSTFTWEKLEKTTFFTIQFFADPKSDPFFSAFTKEALYTLPESCLQNSFSPGRKYYWKVTGFNAESDVIAESETRNFTITAPGEYVKGQVVVVFAESGFSEGLQREMKESYSLTPLQTYSLRALNARMVLFGTLEQDIAGLVEKLRKNKNILLVQPNYLFRTMSDPLCKNQYANTMLNIDKLHKVSMGRGVKVAVIDTGVDADHEDLKARVSVKKNFVDSESYVPEIHGTAVAGVIAASINGSGIEGVAPEASIIALRACRQASAENPEGECRTDSLARALDEAIDQRVHIANMSFGTPHYDSLLARLIERGNEKGILFVAPASNVKNDRRLRFPASHPAVISVGGLDEQMNPYPNSDIAKASCACAPALNILTTVPGNKHNFMNGTSLSAAYISGILALALEKDKSISKKTLPVYRGDICKWEEELLKIKICEK